MTEQNGLTDDERAWRSTPDTVVLAVEEQARKFYSEGRLERARQLCEKLIKMRPQVSQYHALLGVIHRREDRLVPALQALQTAVDLDANNRNALVNLAECLVIAGKVPEGAKLLRAIFDEGYDPEKPPEEHDVFTKRAGAQLALLQKVVEGVSAEMAE